ncbi:hypothetical protein SAMN06265222_12430 [Neorhodopirellula lusitana]|uniref:Non-specific serine/threonine protein kinase n=1 Tax=Neorhodopirellula lusitana TaxID=445327 RepID=A0ABY1QQT8_9BACT|nr:protein kinase [Neorhodopirellula lusitana]SMP78016.1 hypothetical protein SAMN06265222_12430 [Neorhodopirellula lusitana]
MTSLLDTIAGDAGLASRLAAQAVDSQTLTIVPETFGGDASWNLGEPLGESTLDPPMPKAPFARHPLEGFVPARKVVSYGKSCGAQNVGAQKLTGQKPNLAGQKLGTPSGGNQDSGSETKNDAEYRLIGKLGSGGTAIVYQAHQRAIDREVAIKLLRRELAGDPASRMRFLTEARVIGSLDHPNVIALHDLCVDSDGQLFYSMKRIDGTSWSEQLDERSVEENLKILLRVADAIRYAHSRGLIHRDLKPDNVMLGRFGESLVADWGLAISIERTEARSEQARSEQTGSQESGDASVEPIESDELSKPSKKTGAIGGTPAYMAPEQAMGSLELLGTHTDVYLLGGILYRILTGKPPHTGANLLECIHAAANNRIQRTDVSGELIEAAMRAMSTDPRDRFANVEDLIAAITDHRTHQESERLVRRAKRRVWPEDEAAVNAVDPYQRFRAGEALLNEALALWPGNRGAAETLERTQLELARFAASHGDLDLSLMLYETTGQGETEAASRVRRELEHRERVKESQAKYSALFTQSPDAGLLLRWSDGVVMEANEAILEMLGYEKGELVGRRVSELSIWASTERRELFVEQLTQDRRADNFETQFTRKGGGTLIDVLISARTVDVGGTEMLLSTFRDITHRRETERNLEQSRRRLRDLQRLAGLGTWTFDPSTKAVHWSEEAFRITGRNPRLGEPSLHEFLASIHPEDRESVRDAISLAATNGASYEIVYRIRDDEGNYRKLLARGRPVLDEFDRTTEVYGVLQPLRS